MSRRTVIVKAISIVKLEKLLNKEAETLEKKGYIIDDIRILESIKEERYIGQILCYKEE